MIKNGSSSARSASCSGCYDSARITPRARPSWCVRAARSLPCWRTSTPKKHTAAVVQALSGQATELRQLSALRIQPRTFGQLRQREPLVEPGNVPSPSKTGTVQARSLLESARIAARRPSGLTKKGQQGRHPAYSGDAAPGITSEGQKVLKPLIAQIIDPQPRVRDSHSTTCPRSLSMFLVVRGVYPCCAN